MLTSSTINNNKLIEEENYFTLSNPSINNKPQPTTATLLNQNNSSLLNRRKQHQQQLNLSELNKNIVNTNLIDPMINHTNPLSVYNPTYIQPMPNKRKEKVYSFVTIPGTNQKKRPRRRYDEIERLYHCNWPGCTKSYGTLNHLNAHVSMQNHGPKRSPNEFKEMRKEWRKQKKEKESHKKKNYENHNLLNQSFTNLNDFLL